MQAKTLNDLLAAAGAAMDEGLAFVRKDDPHRLATLAREFEGRRGMMQLVVRYLPGDRVHVGLELHGRQAQHGGPYSVEVFGVDAQQVPGSDRAH